MENLQKLLLSLVVALFPLICVAQSSATISLQQGLVLIVFQEGLGSADDGFRQMALCQIAHKIYPFIPCIKTAETFS